jgi:ubiquinone/menaquinone biosynthesis C-methylase UbiE
MHRSAHSASAHSATIATPRLYELTFELMTLGTRRATFRRLLAASGARPGDRVLDLGCGTGYFARMLARVPGTHVVGLDASPEMVAYATRRARKQPNCRFDVGAAEKLAYPDASIDVVVSSLFLHHVPADTQPQVIAEIQRVLRPGGKALIAEIQVPRRGLARWLFQQTGATAMASHVPPLEKLFHEAGFTTITRASASAWLFYVSATRR